MPRSFVSARDQAQMTAPWRLAYDIQSPAPGAPIVPKSIPKTRDVTQDPTNDPAGYMSERPVGYGDMVKNIVSHYHGASDDEKKSGRLWYKAAHDMFHTFAKDNDVSPEKAVGYGAAFSPLTDWGDNVHHAQQFHFGYRPNDNPDHNEHDWQQAHIHPAALDSFRQQTGREVTDSDEDLHHLADLHDGLFRQGKNGTPRNDLNNPETRANWIGNIQHKGIAATLQDHEGQKAATPASKANGYAPVDSMRSSGINTLGGNIKKAKDLYHAPDDVAKMFKTLGGPKISHFYDNILDDTPISEDGYYAHPGGDWTQNKDLGGTIDSHHIRAVTMPHGGWQRKGYSDKDGKGNPSSAAEYDVFNRGLLEATHHVNSTISDPSKHITPKQLQAVVWLKHKNDKDFFERQKNPQTGQPIQHESELGGAGRPADWQFADKSYKSRGKAAALDRNDLAAMPPLWQQMFTHRQPAEWDDILESWVQHYAPNPAQHDGSNVGQDPGQDPDATAAAQAHLGAFYDPFEFSHAEGPHDNPWTGAEAEGLNQTCPYCKAGPQEMHSPHCPVNHSEDPGKDFAALGGQLHTAPDDTMHRLNSVRATLAWVDSITGGI